MGDTVKAHKLWVVRDMASSPKEGTEDTPESWTGQEVAEPLKKQKVEG
jgi:hypothetical protein